MRECTRRVRRMRRAMVRFYRDNGVHDVADRLASYPVAYWYLREYAGTAAARDFLVDYNRSAT